MNFLLVPSTITVTVNSPVLDRLIDYLKSKNDNAANVQQLADAAADLNQSTSGVQAALDAQPT